MPKYMLIMRQTDAAIEAAKTADVEQIINAMGAFNTAMVDAGVLLDGDGLSSPDEGFVVDFSGETPVVTDGPYGETHELFNGFWILQVSSKQEAAEWARRAPMQPGQSLEVRRITDASDFADFADNDYIKNEPELRQRSKPSGA